MTQKKESNAVILTRIEGWVQYNSEKMDDLKEDVKGMDTKLDDISERVVRLESDMEAHEKADKIALEGYNSKISRVYWVIGIFASAAIAFGAFMLNLEYQILSQL